jgi:calcineurin-like phosphoesterase family protein
VFILGDVSCYDTKTTVNILKNLKGQKHLILGNHDYQFLYDNEFRNQFVEIKNYKE